MLLKRASDLKYSDITPREDYLNRRKFLYGLGLAGGLALAGKSVAELIEPSVRAYASTTLTGVVKGQFNTDEKVTPTNVVTTYNNYYEFGTEKDQPAKNAQKFVTSPWSVSVEGEVAKPRKFSMEEILKLAPLEERIYRHRCVEAWSIVVPWIGFSFSTIAKIVEPTAAGQADIECFGLQLHLKLGLGERVTAGVERAFDLLLGRVDQRAARLFFVGSERGKRLEQLGDSARLTQIPGLGVFETGRRGTWLNSSRAA